MLIIVNSENPIVRSIKIRTSTKIPINVLLTLFIEKNLY